MKRGQADTEVTLWPEEVTVRSWDRYYAQFGIVAPKRCFCGDVGFLVKDVEPRDKDFGRVFPCPYCKKGKPLEPPPDYPPYTNGEW